MMRPESILNSWKSVRGDTAQAVEDFAGQPLDYKPTADLMSFGDIARHILQAGHILAAAMLDGVDNMTGPDFAAIRAKYANELPATDTPSALAAELRSRLETDRARLASQPAEFYSGEITRFDGQRVTRLEMLQVIKEHELTHRAQLFMYLRLNGVVPPTTRRRTAKANA
ncbi:MAG TPA: DinB family protein [Bryobacteraceae bacterium]|nr:DinB family protein [Bryobacteraceae bacterium]